MPDRIRVTVDQSALGSLDSDPGILAAVEQVAEAAAELMRKRAPKDTGEGAESIHVEPDDDEPGFRIGWDPDHFYMLFPEFGTEHQPARPFMRPTADEFNSR
jgi:HK97 gp10 family phage protein